MGANEPTDERVAQYSIFFVFWLICPTVREGGLGSSFHLEKVFSFLHKLRPHHLTFRVEITVRPEYDKYT